MLKKESKASIKTGKKLFSSSFKKGFSNPLQTLDKHYKSWNLTILSSSITIKQKINRALNGMIYNALILKKGSCIMLNQEENKKTKIDVYKLFAQKQKENAKQEEFEYDIKPVIDTAENLSLYMFDKYKSNLAEKMLKIPVTDNFKKRIMTALGTINYKLCQNYIDYIFAYIVIPTDKKITNYKFFLTPSFIKEYKEVSGMTK